MSRFPSAVDIESGAPFRDPLAAPQKAEVRSQRGERPAESNDRIDRASADEKAAKASPSTLSIEPTRRFDLGGDPQIVVRSADGERLAFALPSRGVVVVGTDGDGRRLIAATSPASIALSPDGSKLLSVDQDGRARIYDADSGRNLGDLVEAGATAVAFSGTGNQAIVGTRLGEAQFYSTESLATVAAPIRLQRTAITALAVDFDRAFSPEGLLYSGGSDGTVSRVALRMPRRAGTDESRAPRLDPTFRSWSEAAVRKERLSVRRLERPARGSGSSGSRRAGCREVATSPGKALRFPSIVEPESGSKVNAPSLARREI